MTPPARRKPTPPPPGVTRVRLDCRGVTVSHDGESQRWLWRNLKRFTFATLRDFYLARGYAVVEAQRAKVGRVHTLILEHRDVLTLARVNEERAA